MMLKKYFLEEIEFSSCKACYKCKTHEIKCFQKDGISENPGRDDAGECDSVCNTGILL